MALQWVHSMQRWMERRPIMRLIKDGGGIKCNGYDEVKVMKEWRRIEWKGEGSDSAALVVKHAAGVRECIAELIRSCYRRRRVEILPSGAQQMYYRNHDGAYCKGCHVRKIADEVRVQIQMRLGVSHIRIEIKGANKQALHPGALWTSTVTQKSVFFLCCILGAREETVPFRMVLLQGMFGIRNLCPEASSDISDLFYNNSSLTSSWAEVYLLSSLVSTVISSIFVLVFFSNILQNPSLRQSEIIFFGAVKTPTTPALPSRNRKEVWKSSSWYALFHEDTFRVFTYRLPTFFAEP